MKKMQSLKELYRVGYGPSSSHTIAIGNASQIFKDENPIADRFEVILYGSLAFTGVGHGTDQVILKTLHPIKTEIIFDEATEPPHPNTLDIKAFKGKELLGEARFYSVGGGAIQREGKPEPASNAKYKHSKFTDIKEYCQRKSLRLWEYVVESEGEQILDYLSEVWTAMKKSVEAGIVATGVLPGPLNINREARGLYDHAYKQRLLCEDVIVSTYAFAVAEENAGGGRIVTAPTCGACGVVPAVLYHMQKTHEHGDEQIIKALAAGGLIGNLVKTNASISGAEAGCQAEIGTACSMAAAALGELFDLSIERIEIAAEMAMEHFLGLTCDPVAGLVQIPCIERNAVAAQRAINAMRMASAFSQRRKIQFDLVVDVMYETGKDMQPAYRETSKGGLAKMYRVEEEK